ncbi:MAG: glycosyltransferase family protein [Candidatus Omnitrophica bacterium]|nr:glycosyltransferase family protein [Candidatus Omnitrophota bacterium]
MILAIVQARMSSTRLPGKVMKKILGKPMIGHLLARLSLSKGIDKIILATSHLSENNELADYVQNCGFDVYRGSESDVLDRFCQVAKQYDPDGIVRITGDCPLVDPKVCDQVIGAFLKEKFDYVKVGLTFAEGLDCEVFTLNTLKKVWAQAKLSSEREHVMLYVFNHQDEFKTSVLENTTNDGRYRFSVDEQSDFQVVTAVFEYFHKKSIFNFSGDDVKAYLDEHENVYELNMNIVRNEGLIKSLERDQEVNG